MKITVALACILFLAGSFMLEPLAAQQGFTRASKGKVLILQSNSGGDNIHIIDPATNTVVGEIDDVPIPHGVTYHPDGSVYYISNEFNHTLDVISTTTLKAIKQIPLADGPNNVGITPDG